MAMALFHVQALKYLACGYVKVAACDGVDSWRRYGQGRTCLVCFVRRLDCGNNERFGQMVEKETSQQRWGKEGERGRWVCSK